MTSIRYWKKREKSSGRKLRLSLSYYISPNECTNNPQCLMFAVTISTLIIWEKLPCKLAVNILLSFLQRRSKEIANG